jgi:hypothetical protein
MAEKWNFNESLVEAVAHHHDEKWARIRNRGGRLCKSVRCGFGRFQQNVELFTCMHFPLNWHFNELRRVEEIFREEMSKASSLMNAPSAEKAPSEKD